MKKISLVPFVSLFFLVASCHEWPPSPPPQTPKKTNQKTNLEVLREPFAKFTCLTTLAGEVDSPKFSLHFDEDPSLALAYLEGRSLAIVQKHPEFAEPCNFIVPSKEQK